ncbi:MAG: FAD:protein FMN transferase [Pirellula sp.]
MTRSGPPIWLEFSRRAMACQFDVLLHPNLPIDGPEHAIQALELIDFLEQLFSVYIPTSDLSRLNLRGNDIDVDVALPTLDLLRIAKTIHQKTDGAFDITAASLSDVWGFSSRAGKMPDENAIHEALQRVGSQFLLIDEEKSQVQFTRPISVNPGGIGKGYAIDQAAQLLLDHGVSEFAIHGGKSSVRAHGRQQLEQSAPGWKIAVRHPEQSERILGSLILKNLALGTSGPANQFFYFRGVRYGHIIDPRTGWPAQGPLSVTVLHPSATWADALATALYVMGVDQAIQFCQSNSEVGMLALLPGERQGSIEVVTCNIDTTTWIPAT